MCCFFSWISRNSLQFCPKTLGIPPVVATLQDLRFGVLKLLGDTRWLVSKPEPHQSQTLETNIYILRIYSIHVYLYLYLYIYIYIYTYIYTHADRYMIHLFVSHLVSVSVSGTNLNWKNDFCWAVEETTILNDRIIGNLHFCWLIFSSFTWEFSDLFLENPSNRYTSSTIWWISSVLNMFQNTVPLDSLRPWAWFAAMCWGFLSIKTSRFRPAMRCLLRVPVWAMNPVQTIKHCINNRKKQ